MRYRIFPLNRLMKNSWSSAKAKKYHISHNPLQTLIPDYVMMRSATKRATILLLHIKYDRLLGIIFSPTLLIFESFSFKII